MSFHRDVINIDPAQETERIVQMLRFGVRKILRRYGGVVGVSGGIDSSVVLALCARAFGPQKVVAVLMPEDESSPESAELGRQVASTFGVEAVLEDMTGALDGLGCYRRRDEAIQRVFPEFDAQAGYKSKIVLPNNLLDANTLNVFYLTIITPDGEEKTTRLPVREYLQIVAASNFKQRSRMAMLYYHAELNNFAVIGTANKNEHDQGFFVKYGDGGVDIKPIAHLYKTQVYQLAKYLGIPEEIQNRTPTTDTYSAHSTQEEFFFRLPFEVMDLLWYAQEQGLSTGDVAQEMGLTETQIQAAYDDFTRKNRTTEYMRQPPLGIAEVEAYNTIKD